MENAPPPPSDTLFSAAGLDARRATPPLADRLRPQKARRGGRGQDHIVGPKRARWTAPAWRPHASARSCFWGPPGTGKDDGGAGCLPAKTKLVFVQISAIFSGVADLKKVFEEARHRREMGQGTLLFVDEIHRFNRAQQDGPSCP